MRELLDPLRGWLDDGTPFAVATVVDVLGSAPRRPGAAMAVTADGRVAGSVSGGCVEGAVYEAAGESIRTGAASWHTYGISDDDAFAVGLTCGGTLGVLVRPYTGPGERAVLAGLLDALGRAESVALATVTGGSAPLGAQQVVRGGGSAGSLGDPGLDRAARLDALGSLAQGATGVRRYGTHGELREQDVTVFVQTFTPPPRMLVFGAIDHAAATARMGAFLGYRVTVCDARPAFATRERFPFADEVVRAWPHDYLARTEVDERTVLCVLTHDPKFDIPLLLAALRTPAGYIGVMGSRRTHEDRRARLRAEGVGERDLARLAAPIGLDLGARTAEETAVSIAAEIVKSRWGGTGLPLAGLAGAIHGPAPAAPHRLAGR
ncbi:xanthine dehydrogenase accessory factor [Actinacidiphila yanglinensis]|uniref:Xanthine dehydrogenase accessory factor n=1 Tax=Actinacidiphila yanglinensis TaxID=310779 RepID=A0A1H6EE76_9ACTN|nr:XdhC/CoxI family protein [Actinacidiphila yanglinensis]SEG96118.1 xanthine dehydrogenase accessory factor [Actinacidiphila yanglinensis]